MWPILRQNLSWIVLACALLPQARAADYWVYVGAYTDRGGKGIPMFKFHSATGKIDSEGLAAGKLWQSGDGPTRLAAQVRAEWPDLKMIARGVQNPTFLAIHPNGRFVYSADQNQPGTISAFEIVAGTGKLKMLNTKPSGGGLPCFLSVDKSGKNVLVANFSGTATILPLQSDGTLKDATCIIKPGAQSKVHSFAVSPDNRFAIAVDMGLSRVLVYKFNPDKGTATPNDPAFVQMPPGAGARHFTFHPSGAFAYLIEESGFITGMRWDATRGALTPIETLSTIPKDFTGQNAPAEVFVHPGGNFLYGSNRGNDSISVFAIDQSRGTLTPVQYAPSKGHLPRNFQIDPTGNFLLVGNVTSNNIVEFRIDRQTGRLTPTGVTVSAQSPACITFVPVRP